MRIDQFDFDLPPELIAQEPPPSRSGGRLLDLSGEGAPVDRMIVDLPGLLRPQDLLVFNDTRVLPALVEACGAGDQDYVRVTNPVAPEQARIRRHVMPSLLQAVAPNLRELPEVRMVELGKGYRPEHRDEHRLPAEHAELAMVFARGDEASSPGPFGELREGVIALLDRCGFARAVLEQSLTEPGDATWLHPGKNVAVVIDGETVGHVGLLHPRVAGNLDLPSSTAVASLELRSLLAVGRSERRMQPIPRFPSQPVDVALVVGDSVRVADVAAFLRRVGKKQVRDVRLFEVYRGSNLPAAHKSLNFTVVLGANDRTLTADDEARFLARVRQGAAEIGAELRG